MYIVPKIKTEKDMKKFHLNPKKAAKKALHTVVNYINNTKMVRTIKVKRRQKIMKKKATTDVLGILTQSRKNGQAAEKQRTAKNHFPSPEATENRRP